MRPPCGVSVKNKLENAEGLKWDPQTCGSLFQILIFRPKIVLYNKVEMQKMIFAYLARSILLCGSYF